MGRGEPDWAAILEENAMKGTLMRGSTDNLGTRGNLTLENGWGIDTLELPWRGNAEGVSCIKAGAYHGVIGLSAHLGRDVVKLDDKNGRSEVEMHNGNFAGDVALGYFTQVKGCVLIGSGYGPVILPDGSGKQQLGILNSVTSLGALLAQLGGEDLYLEVEWQHDIWPDDDV